MPFKAVLCGFIVKIHFAAYRQVTFCLVKACLLEGKRPSLAIQEMAFCGTMACQPEKICRFIGVEFLFHEKVNVKYMM